MTEEEKIQFNQMKEEIADLRYILSRKTGLGPSDIRGVIKQPSTLAATIAANSVNKSSLNNDAVGVNELDYELVTVTISAGQPSGTGTCTSGSIIAGWYPTTNLDQIIDDISISGTTLTVTLAGNATATTTIKAFLIKT